MRYITKRIGYALLTLFAVANLSFALIQLLPGGPMEYLRQQMRAQAQDVDPQRLASITEVYTNVNPEKPFLVQYVDYMSSLLKGDLGTSIWFNKPVIDILLYAAPWTVLITGVAIFLTYGVGLLLGAFMAYTEGSRFDSAMTVFATFQNSVPYFLAALLLLFVLSLQFGLFPTGGNMSATTEVGFTLDFFLDVSYHAILPILSIFLTSFGGVALTMRGNSISVLGKDFVRVANLRGLPTKDMAFRYVGRNAVLPMYTSFMISVGYIFGGTVILETIFKYPGLGYFTFVAFEARDYPLMMGGFMLITTAIVICLFIADITYGFIDPRAELGGEDRESY